MLTAVALPQSEVSSEWIEVQGLCSRLVDRGGGTEILFRHQQKPAILPVWHEGRLLLTRWGADRDESKCLPVTGWTQIQSIEEGKWSDCEAEEVLIPATEGCDSGVWYSIRQGVRGLLVCDEHGLQRVYVICEPSSHYYRVMTGSAWMPCLFEQRI